MDPDTDSTRPDVSERPAGGAAAPLDPSEPHEPSGGSTFWHAATHGPLRVLLTPWPWRSLAYLATSLPVAVLWVSLCWPLLLWAGLPLGAVECRRLALMESAPAPSPHVLTRRGSPGWPWTRLTETATWRELAYGVLLVPLSLLESVAVIVLVIAPLTLLASPLVLGPSEMGSTVGAWLLPSLPWVANTAVGAVALVVAAYLTMVLAAGRARLARLMLTTDREEELGERLGEAVRSRSRLVDAFTAERRRIERDLHDGAQQRLTGVIMRLGMARTRFDADPDGARNLVEQAYEDARTTLSELRDLVHGIHPAALTDRGLVAALEELADACALPVTVDAAGVGRLSAAVESTAYFCTAEAVTNAVRHAEASAVRVRLRSGRTRLLLRVVDDGRGGADPARGSGLTGLADRVAAHGGSVRLDSPEGGPTTVEVEIPCVS